MKFMNLKRFASIAMAGVMTMSLMVPAMADDQSTVITATYAETELAVTVPANTNATINPYGLPVTMEDAVTTISGQPITIPTPLMIENQSSVALKVGASISTEVTGLALASSANTVAGGSAKEVYVEFQAFAAAGIDGNTAADPTVTDPKYAALKDEDAALTAVLDSSTPVIATATGDDLVLREGKDSLSQDGGVAFVRLSGVAAKNPTQAWAETDKFVATITYSFEPASYTKSAGTITVNANPSVSGTAQQALTFTSALPSSVTATSTTWKSSDEEVLTVAANGTNVTGLKAGTATVTVTIVGSDGITYTASVDITVAA